MVATSLHRSLMLQNPEELGAWRYLDSGTTENLNDTATPFIANRVFAVGDEGAFLQSDDSGKNWQKRDVGTDRNLYVIRQLNRVIYIGGDSVFLLSIDNGETFKPVPDIDFIIRDVEYTGSVDGAFIAVGDGGRVARASFNGLDLDDIAVSDLTWKNVAVAGTPDLTGVSTSFSHVKIIGKGGFVAISEDAAQTFARNERSSITRDFLAISGDFMAGDGFFARRYTPSGWPVGSFSWTVAENSDLPVIRDLWCLSDCMAIGETNTGTTIVKISEKGEILATEASKIHNRLHSIENLDDGLIAVGANGKILVRDRQD